MVIIQNLSQFQQSAGYIGRQASCYWNKFNITSVSGTILCIYCVTHLSGPTHPSGRRFPADRLFHRGPLRGGAESGGTGHVAAAEARGSGWPHETQHHTATDTHGRWGRREGEEEYSVSVLSTNSDWSCAWVTAVMYAISCCIGPRCRGSPLFCFYMATSAQWRPYLTFKRWWMSRVILL